MAKDKEPISYQALLDENRDLLDKNHSLQDENLALTDEMQSLRTRLAETEELRRAISEGDLDALVLPGPEGKVVFTLDSADRAYRVLVETMNEGTATLAFDGTILYCNRRFAELLRMPIQAIIGTSVYRFIAPESAITFKMLLKHEKNTEEINFRLEDGKSLPVYMSVSSLQIEGSPNAWCLVTTDLKKLKKAEEKIEHLANIVESSNDSIVTESLDGIITSWNKGAEQIYGYSAEEVLGKPISILEPSILVEETVELAELIKQGDKIHNYETLQLRKDGTIINVSLTLSPIYDTPGELTAISVIARNITKSKNAEKELQQSEERYRIVTEQTGQMVYDYDLKTFKNTWAGAIEEVTGYNFEEFQKLGKDFWNENILDSDPNRVYKKFQDKDKKTGDRFKEELRLRRKDGTYGYIENSGVYLMDSDGQPYRAIGVLRDITEKREAEKALAEIDKLRIKEIHHRIKNNLQVISSLLDLQAEKFEDETVKKAFGESQDRVVSMALIHEELYNGEGIHTDTLDFSAYLQKLAENLFQTYSLRSKNIHLCTDLEENLFFDMDTAVPLGIVVNELVSNSLKHAFQGKDNGEILVKLHREESKSEDCKSASFILTISDNGIGIPENLEIEELNSLGLQLVTSLVDQLDGELELKRNGGTEFIIRFTVKEI